MKLSFLRCSEVHCHRRRRSAFRPGRAFFETRLEDRTLLTVLIPGYTESAYVTGLPSAPSGLTIDTSTRTLYYADDGNTGGLLRKIAPDRTISVVSSGFAASP